MDLAGSTGETSDLGGRVVATDDSLQTARWQICGRQKKEGRDES